MPRTVGVVLAHQGVGHLTEGLLTLHNLMGDAGKNLEQNNIKYSFIARIIPPGSHHQQGCISLSHWVVCQGGLVPGEVLLNSLLVR